MKRYINLTVKNSKYALNSIQSDTKTPQTPNNIQLILVCTSLCIYVLLVVYKDIFIVLL